MNKLYIQTETAETILGFPGALISWSKSDYMDRNPNNIVIFNANVCTKEGKIWFGDLDITLDIHKLIKLAKSLNTEVYVLYEMDDRFDTENSPLLDKYIIKINLDGTYKLSDYYQKHYKL